MTAAGNPLSVAIRLARRECTGRDPSKLNELYRIIGRRRIPPPRRVPVVPAIIAGEGEQAAEHFREFFISRRGVPGRPRARAGYYPATRSFFTWLEQRGITDLATVKREDIANSLRARSSPQTR
jgi:hypothetical protein